MEKKGVPEVYPKKMLVGAIQSFRFFLFVLFSFPLTIFPEKVVLF